LLALQVIQLTYNFYKIANKSENYELFLLTNVFISVELLKVNKFELLGQPPGDSNEPFVGKEIWPVKFVFD